MATRIEKDSLGEMEVDDRSYYGIHTVRALKNFPNDFKPTPHELIDAITLIKKCAACVNLREGFIATTKAQAIMQACDEILAGGFSDAFPLPAIQGGAGTSVNMNVNEVVANRAIELLGGKKGDYSMCHPNDDVNRFQSTNDVYPSALKIAAIRLIFSLATDLADLQTALQDKEKEFSDVLKIGRTEMQEAVPITLGQEFGAYSEAIARDRWRVYKCEERLRSLNLGGTAVGTGINAPKIFIFRLMEELRAQTGLGIGRAENMIESTQNADAFVEVSGILKACAVNLIKISGDLRLLSSGPHSGFREIMLPARQAGSSIMPGKINPVIPEYAASAAIQVIACDAAITFAASQGQLELNAFMPTIAVNLIDEIKLLRSAVCSLRENCIEGIVADVQRCREGLEASEAYATLIAPYVGYDKAAEAVRFADSNGIDVREAIIRFGWFTTEETEILFSPRSATSPGIAGSQNFADRIRLKEEK